MTDLNKMLRWSRRLSFVPRWVVMPTIRKQNVAEHSFHVACTSLWLLPMHASGAAEIPSTALPFKLEVLTIALEHDIDEAAKGDVPSPTKARKDPKAFSQQYIVVKVADLLEAIAFVREEETMGNRFGMAVVRDGLFAELHEWWLEFEWSEPMGRKPLTSDLVQAYLKEAVPSVHPVMEA